MQRFNLVIFKQFWAIAKSYWSSDEKWRARGLLVRGPSGCEKSSLLRAIAGLWNAGTGKILCPTLEQMLQDSGMTFLSVGQRQSLRNYHQSILDFTPKQTWSLKAFEALPMRGQ